MDYQKQGKDFLKETNTTFKAEFLRYGKHFDDDKENRDIYKITLSRKGRSYSFNFGQSINASGRFIIVYHSDEFPRGTRIHDKAELNKSRNRYIGFGRYYENNKDFAEPTPYCVLAGLQRNEVGTLEDFCDEFGYDTDSRKAEKVYNAVVNEYNNLKMLFNDKELEKMAEIA